MTSFSILAINTIKFAATLGVCAHLTSTHTAYGDLRAVRSAMTYLGFHNVRDGADAVAQMNVLAGEGLRFDVFVPTPYSLAEFHSRVDQLAAAHPGSIISIEGPNEVDNWPVTYRGRTSYAGAVALQTELFRAMKADPLLAGTAVYAFSVSDVHPPIYRRLGKLAAIADGQPMHYYYGGGQPSWILPLVLGSGQITVPGGAHVLTETGSSTAPASDWGVDEAVQAKQALNLALDAARTRTITYVYELVDEANTPGNPLEDNYGLFRSDWTPKAAARALHNLTRILAAGADPNAAPDRFSYGVSGLPAWEAYTTAFRKTATAHVIAVWREPHLWDDRAHKPISIAPARVTITFQRTPLSADVYDPMISAQPVLRLKRPQAVSLDLTDHPVIIEVTGAAG